MENRSYLIGYDLNSPGRDYKSLFEAIKEVAHGYWHHLDSTWVIRHPGPAKVIRDHLKPYLDANDELLVVGLTGEAAWKGFNEAGEKWIRDYL